MQFKKTKFLNAILWAPTRFINNSRKFSWGEKTVNALEGIAEKRESFKQSLKNDFALRDSDATHKPNLHEYIVSLLNTGLMMNPDLLKAQLF